MNRKPLIALAALTFVGSAAFAQSEIELQHFGAAQTSTTSRAEVKAELQRARAAGDLQQPAEVVAANSATKAQPAGLTRAQVRAEVLKARAEGLLGVPDEVLVATFKPAPSTRTRAEVQAEAVAARKASDLSVQSGY